MMAILSILFIVILDLNKVRKRRIAEKDLSHSHEVTGNVQAIFNRASLICDAYRCEFFSHVVLSAGVHSDIEIE